MKKVLITGSSGYIGSHLVNMLMKTLKYEVHCLDIVDPKATAHRYYRCDINKPVEIDMEFDVIVHLAALVNVSRSTKFPLEYHDTNVNGTVNCLRGLRYKNFVFASTGSAVGMASPYAISKRMAELIVEDFCQKTNKDYTMFRFYNVTGVDGFPPTNPDGLMASLMRAQDEGVFYVYGGDYNTPDGSAIRDYTHVNEICSALVKAIETPSNKLENLGHGVGTSVLEMVKLYKEINGCDFEVEIKDRRPGDLEVSVLDNVSSYMTKMYDIRDLLRR